MGVLTKSKTTQVDCEGQARAEGADGIRPELRTGVEVESANPTRTKAQSFNGCSACYVPPFTEPYVR